MFQFAKSDTSFYLFRMSIWIPVICSAVILVFSVSILRASGVWSLIFAPRNLQPKETFDPLVAAPTGWIENHVFWDNIHSDNGEGELVTDFWENESERFAS